MSRRKSDSRCPACQMRLELCLCFEAEACKKSLSHLSSRVVILMHHREQQLSTNTARLAHLGLPHCEIRIRGQLGKSLDTTGLRDESRQLLFLYPSDDARCLDDEFLKDLSKPVTLLVPDGSWRQASKVASREIFFKDIAKVKLPSALPSRYRLRRETKSEGLATFEAIARALGTLEGNEVQKTLESLFDVMVERTLLSRRGILDKNYSKELL